MIGVLEGILFVVGDEGVTLKQVCEILNIDEEEAKRLLLELKSSYEKDDRGIRISYLGDAFKLTTKKEHKEYYEKLVDQGELTPLSQASLETLAIIAYNQPITRAQVDEMRGVSSQHIIRRLVARNLVKASGKSELPGRPNLYATTSDFLDYFGLSTINDLPKLDDADESSGEERIADTIIGRNLDHYLIRQSLDGIPIGAPSDVEVEYYYSDDEHTTTTRIINDYYKMYYDGANVYEIFTINNDLENKQEQQTLLSFEQAIDFATPAISDILDEASNNDWEAHIYAAELVYLMVLDSDYIDFGSDVSISHNNDESYLSPFWVIYVHTNQVIRGSECVSRKAILINAITGEVLFSS